MSSFPQPDDRNETISALRAVGALAVCTFHLSTGTHVMWVNGAQIFFVVSGCIVPYTMVRAGYSLRSWPRFMLKRAIRLELPYLASVGFILALNALTAAMHGQSGVAPGATWGQVASHAGYLTEILGYRWLNIVYWTLGIEFQFYISIGLLLPVLMRATPAWQIVGIAAAAAIPLGVTLPRTLTIVYHLPVFGAGLLTFLFLRCVISDRTYWCALAVLGAYLVGLRDWSLALTVVGTAAIIATVRLPKIRPVAWVASLSYPLYLMHIPVGSHVLDFMTVRLPDSVTSHVVAVAAAFAASAAAAACLHWLVERPSMRLASRVSYGSMQAARPSKAQDDVEQRRESSLAGLRAASGT